MGCDRTFAVVEKEKKRQITGPIEPLNGHEREIRTRVFDDEPTIGIIHALQQLGEVTYKDIGDYILYGSYTVKNIMRDFLTHTLLRAMVTRKERKIKGSKRTYYSLDPRWKNVPLAVLHNLVLISRDASREFPIANKGPNGPERKLVDILNKIESGKWKYTGDKSVPGIPKYRPDFLNKSENILIEHLGDYWHANHFVGYKWESVEEEKITKEAFYKGRGYDVIWIHEYELTNPEVAESKLIEELSRIRLERANKAAVI